MFLSNHGGQILSSLSRLQAGVLVEGGHSSVRVRLNCYTCDCAFELAGWASLMPYF